MYKTTEDNEELPDIIEDDESDERVSGITFFGVKVPTPVPEDTEKVSRITEDTMTSEDREFAAKINMHIPHTEFKDLRAHTNTFKRMLRLLLMNQLYVPVRYMMMSKEEFERQTSTLYKCCLKIVRDRHELHKRRVMGMTILNDIILRVDPLYITMDHVIHLTWSVMSCIHHFQLRLKTGAKGLITYTRKRQVQKCMKSYSRLIRIFPSKMHRVVLNSILTFYQEGKLWLIEFSCRDLIVDLLNIYANAGEAISDTLSMIERVAKRNVMTAKYLVQVLYQTLGRVRWRRMSKKLMERFIFMLERSMLSKPTDRVNYMPLKNGLQMCVRNAIRNMQNEGLMLTITIIITKLNTVYLTGLPKDVVTCLANTAAYAASKYSMKTFYKVLTSAFMSELITFIHNENHKFLFGFRIWRNLLDRNRNSIEFLTPRIFFRDGKYKIKIRKCIPADKLYLKSCTHVVYPTTMHGFIMAENKKDLELIFQAIAVTLVEIPCGYSASIYIAILMGVQDYALRLSKENLIKSHYLHAIIMSIMTLICYIHKADAFYEYVTTVMARRAQWAPHLNPPLKSSYAYAQHHILWNKRDFFFEDWEARYGLWKCFRKRKRK